MSKEKENQYLTSINSLTDRHIPRPTCSIDRSLALLPCHNSFTMYITSATSTLKKGTNEWWEWHTWQYLRKYEISLFCKNKYDLEKKRIKTRASFVPFLIVSIFFGLQIPTNKSPFSFSNHLALILIFLALAYLFHSFNSLSIFFSLIFQGTKGS